MPRRSRAVLPPRSRSTSPVWPLPGARGTRAAARCAVPNWSPFPISRPRPAPAAAHARPNSTVSLERTFSETTNSSSFFSAARATSASGSDTAGLVPITHSALISPRPIASNIWTAFSPSWVAMRGAFQNRRTRSMSGGVKPIWAASWLASPPTSRPPIALGCPVSENGDAPGLPIRPVARWQLMMALTLSVPCADWLTPCEYSVTTRGVLWNIWKKSATSGFRQPGRQRGRGNAAGDAARARQRVVEAGGVASM